MNANDLLAQSKENPRRSDRPSSLWSSILVALSSSSNKSPAKPLQKRSAPYSPSSLASRSSRGRSPSLPLLFTILTLLQRLLFRPAKDTNLELVTMVCSSTLPRTSGSVQMYPHYIFVPLTHPHFSSPTSCFNFELGGLLAIALASELSLESVSESGKGIRKIVFETTVCPNPRFSTSLALQKAFLPEVRSVMWGHWENRSHLESVSSL